MKIAPPKAAGERRKPVRLRDMKHAAAEIKRQDPETAITYDLIRRSVITGALPYRQVGRKKLVDIDTLEERLFLQQEKEAV